MTIREFEALQGSARMLNPLTLPVADAELDETRLIYMLSMSLDAQISIADAKAQLILTANAILATGIALNSTTLRPLIIAAALPERVAAALTLMMLLAILGSVFCALISSRPNLRRPNASNMFFYGYIEQMDEEAYTNQFMAMTQQDIKRAVFQQIHARSRVIMRKYRYVRYSLDFLFVALGLWILARVLLGLV